jgi:C-methyltransferase
VTSAADWGPGAPGGQENWGQAGGQGNWTQETGPLPLNTDPGQPSMAVAADLRRRGMEMWTSAIIQAAGRLRLADVVGDDPTDYRDLAAKADADPAALLRLLRALVAAGIFRSDDGSRFSHTPASLMLREGVPGSVLNLNLLGASEWNWTIWSRLTDAIRTGSAVFPARYGKDLYRYFAEDNPEAGEVFNKAMSESGQWTSEPLVAALALGEGATVADVGGGQGGLLRLVLERNPSARGFLVDSAPVAAQADPALRAGPLAERCTIVPADIRQAVPASADVYIMRQVMHIWQDEDVVRILGNCRASARPGARVVLVEHVVSGGEKPNSTFTTLIDLQMMLLGLGKERTGEEFTALFAAAGLEFTGITPLAGPLQMIAGRLAGE